MQPDIMPLVLTPRPYKFESLKGFILRSSEANGYTSPTTMLSSAGLTNGEMISIIPPLEKLAPLFNLSTAEIVKLGYRKPLGSPSAKHIWLHNHQLPTYYLNIKVPKICTECIVESGFTESFWDLKHAIACPKHNRYLLKTCPDCKKQLSWFRLGLLTCKCGCDLSKHRGEVLDNQPVLGLLAFLRNQLKREPHDNNLLRERLGFPVEHLRTLTLAELLSIIVKFENKGNYSKSTLENHKCNQEGLTLAKVSQALENWPEGLYQYLDSFHDERASPQGFGLRKQFESFCGSLFKSDIPKEKIAFIKDAFIKFGTDEWKQAYVTNKLDGGTGQGKQLVGICGVANALGVMNSTAKKIVKQELIPNTVVTYNGRSRMLFDLDQGMPFKASIGASYTVRKAAAWLGLPVSVLKTLRKQGDYEVRHIANPTTAYHQLDLNAFRDRLLACRTVSTLNLLDECLTLKQVMLMKTGADAIKASFVSAILSGKLLSIGSIDESVDGMQFTRSDVMQFMVVSKREFFGLITVVAAAKQLHCDPLVVKNLYTDGIVSGNQQSNGLFIRQDSLDAFGERYVSCAAIASKQSSNSTKIVSLCKKNMIALHLFPRAIGQNPQPFVERKLAQMKLSL